MTTSTGARVASPPAGCATGGGAHEAPHRGRRSAVYQQTVNQALVERVRAIKEAQWAEQVRVV